MSSSSLFNLPILTEATQSKPSELVARFIPMNNLATTTKYLNDFNSAVVAMETSMLMAVSEAESTKKENEVMARYFEEYGSEVKKLIQKINQQSSKFIININNFLDANDTDIDSMDFNTQGITYKKKCYNNLTNPELPKISIKKIFKKEYAILGKLLQDLKHAPLSDEARVTAITSVYDALISSMGRDWVDTCIQVITGDDNCNTNDFSSTMYSKFMYGEKVVEIDAGEISQAKFTLHSNTTIAAKQISASFDELINELVEVSDEIEHIWFRNSENMIEIKTDEDGIADAKYALTDYSMNRVHQIIKAKIDQLNEVTNLYLIALSIKMDCIMKSAKQAREIIDIAMGSSTIASKPADTSSEEDPLMDDGSDDIDLPEDDDTTDESIQDTPEIEEPVQGDNLDDGTEDYSLEDNMNDIQEAVLQEGVAANIQYISRLKSRSVFCCGKSTSNIATGSYFANTIKSGSYRAYYTKALKEVQCKSDCKYLRTCVTHHINAGRNAVTDLTKLTEKERKKKYVRTMAKYAFIGGAVGAYSMSNADMDGTQLFYTLKPDNISKACDFLQKEILPAIDKKEQAFIKAANESAILDEEAQFERDCYLFESSANRIQLLAEQLYAYNEVYEAINELTHAEAKIADAAQKVGKDSVKAVQPYAEKTQTTTQQNSQQTTKVANNNPANADKVKVNAIAEKINGLIAALINKVRELVQKFQSVVVNKNNARITEIKNNQKTILTNGANGGGEAVEYNIKNLMELKMHIDYPKYKQQLGSEENAEKEYIKAAFPQLDMKDDVSLTEALTKIVVTEEKKIVTRETINNAVIYITKQFDEIAKQIQQSQNELTTKSHNVKNEAIKYMKESSTLEETMFHYFTEFDAPSSSGNDNNNGGPGQEVVVQKDAKGVTKDIKGQLMIMYKVNSTVLTTKMSLAQKAFNEYYSICKFFMTNTVVPKSEANQQQQNDNNQSK